MAALARLSFSSGREHGHKVDQGASIALATTRGAGGSVAMQGVYKTYSSAEGSVGALSNVALDVPAGSIFGIIGRSGAGKSTLLRMINRLESPSKGTVLVDGHDLARLDKLALVALRRRVGMVFQHFNLLSAKTVRDNVALPLVVAGVRRGEVERRVEDALALVGLQEKRDAYPSRLSGGQKQRVGIARALVSGPRILLCDEATSALDPETTLSILRLLKDLNRRLGLTIVLITHEMSVIREICDRVLVLERGEAVETGPVWQVFGEPAHPATRALLLPLARGLPEDLAARLQPEARPGCRNEVLVELRFTGRSEPDLARLAALVGGPVRLLDGRIDRIAGHTEGRLLLAAAIPPDGTLPDLSTVAVDMKVLGYVAVDD